MHVFVSHVSHYAGDVIDQQVPNSSPEAGYGTFKNPSPLYMALTVPHCCCFSFPPIFTESCTRQPLQLLVTLQALYPVFLVEVAGWNDFSVKIRGEDQEQQHGMVSAHRMGKVFVGHSGSVEMLG